MTLEEMFCDFYEKYGDDFNWRMLPFSDKGFVEELKRELGEDNLIFDKEIFSISYNGIVSVNICSEFCY